MWRGWRRSVHELLPRRVSGEYNSVMSEYVESESLDGIRVQLPTGVDIDVSWHFSVGLLLFGVAALLFFSPGGPNVLSIGAQVFCALVGLVFTLIGVVGRASSGVPLKAGPTGVVVGKGTKTRRISWVGVSRVVADVDSLVFLDRDEKVVTDIATGMMGRSMRDDLALQLTRFAQAYGVQEDANADPRIDWIRTRSEAMEQS